MDTALALDTLDAAVAAARAVDVAVVSVPSLKAAVLRVQAAIAHLQVTQAAWLQELEARAAFGVAGERDAASWLAAHGLVTKGAARRQAELGRAMHTTPLLADAVGSGALSPDAALALVPAVSVSHSGTVDDVADLFAACAGATPAEARAAGVMFLEHHPPAGTTPAERDHQLRRRRALRFSDNGDGTTDITGTLVNADAAVIERALKSLITKPCDGDDRTYEQKLADALLQLCDSYGRGQVRGGRGNAPTVLITIDAFDLANNTGYGLTADGKVIPVEAVRRITENAFVQRVLLADSVVLDEGRRQRLATDDQWRAMAARDGGCRFPGCTIPAGWCQADHLEEYDAQHGETNIDLMVLWCVYHHTYRHRPDVHIHGDANNLTMTLPDGRTIPMPARGPTIKQRGAA